MWVLFLVNLAFAVITSLLAPTQKMKAGSIDDFDFPRIDDGSPIFFIAGRVRIDSPNLTWYGDFQNRAIKKRSGLFKKSTVGYKYFLGWQLALCLGPNVVLKKLWFGGDEPIFEGSASSITDQVFSDEEAFGGETGGGGYHLNIDFYPGSNDQAKSLYLDEHIEGPIPNWRGLSYLVARGYIGNSTSLPLMQAEVERIPDPLGLGVLATIGDEGDANPANVIYEIMTNSFGALGINPVKINTASFVAAGQLFYDEDEGFSGGWGGSPSEVSKALQDILHQVDATLYEDPVDGQVYLKPIREDYVIADLVEFNESNIMEMASYSINLWGDTKNKVRVKFTDRQRDYKNDAIAVAEDMSNIAFQSEQVKAVNVDYPHIKRLAHARRHATRDLQIYSTPIANVRATSLRFDMNLRPGTPVKLSYPEYEIADLVMRVKSVDLGDLTNNRLVVELVSDKFSKTDAIYGGGENVWEKPSLNAASITQHRVIEAPRWFNNAQSDVIDVNAPRVMALPRRPNGSQLSYTLFGRVVGEASYQELGFEIDYPNYATLYTSYSESYTYDTTTGLELASIDDEEALVVASASEIQNQGINLIMIDDEIMAFETYEVNGSGRYVLKGIRRGLLDTVPAAHSAGARVVWLGADHVGAREFGDTDAVEVVMASNAPKGAQTADTGRYSAVPGSA